MTTQSAVFRPLNQRSLAYYYTPLKTSIPIVAPARANIIRVALVGCGGWRNDGSAGQPGAGGAFARTQEACDPGDEFTLFLGDCYAALSSTSTDAETWLRRESDATVICKADYARNLTQGLAANSIGDTKRDGNLSSSNPDFGKSGGDDADTIEWGFGELGRYQTSVQGAAGPGGGGVYNGYTYQDTHWTWRPGSGAACVAFFINDPGYT